jgi:anaerobic ribonucleoside-triphosphate reductase activating protein
MMLQVAGVLHGSTVNGPGRRNVLHLQGCTLGCGGCFNPGTHDAAAGRRQSLDDVVSALVPHGTEAPAITISGGEPFQQLPGLVALLRRLRQRGVDSILVFSGYALEELQAMAGSGAALAEIDVLVAGRYVATEATGLGLCASANQRAHLITHRHTLEELQLGESAAVEITILPDGNVVMSGFPSPAIRRAIAALDG